MHKRADPRPVPQTRDGLTAGPRPPSALGAAQSNVFFLNYDGVSIQFTGQEDDSAANVSQFQEFQGNYAAYGDGAKRTASLQAVLADWAKYDVVITDQRPNGGPYTMCVVSPTNPFGGGVLGIAPLDCNDEQARNIVFAYHSDSDQFTAAVQATTMSQEIAHAYGLEHVQQPNDIMNPYNEGLDPSFLDQCLSLDGGGQGILCGQQHQQFCGNGSQNSHRELLWLFGEGEPDVTPPTVTITFPADGAELPAGSSFEITAAASDDVGVAEVELFNNGSFIQTDALAPFSWGVQNIPAGDYCFTATAHDFSDNTADSDEVCITVTSDAPDPPETTADPGETSNASADSGNDAAGDTGADPGDASGDEPTAPTSGGDASGSPDDDDGGGGFPGDTFPSVPDPDMKDDGCGCLVAPSAPASLLLVGLLGLLRRRRR
ncbi:MAG: hypothetical protein JNL82_10075 [Myxococcales bacterium]|nr:hypothetical protein [Myxococcales bacterium]